MPSLSSQFNLGSIHPLTDIKARLIDLATNLSFKICLNNEIGSTALINYLKKSPEKSQSNRIIFTDYQEYSASMVLIDNQTTLSDLKGVITYIFANLLEKPLEIQLIQGDIDWCEPAVQIKAYFEKLGWIKVAKGGMIHPSFLLTCGLNPKVYQGWQITFDLAHILEAELSLESISKLSSSKFSTIVKQGISL